MPTPLTRSDLFDLIQADLTDPLNGQNTAARVREVFEALVISSANVLEDGTGGGGSPDLSALITKINSKQDKAATVAQDAYAPGNPSRPLTTVLEQLQYLFEHIGSIPSLYYQRPDALTTRNAGQLPAGRPLAYIGSDWNGEPDTAVYVHVLEQDRFAPQGWLLRSGTLTWADIDLDANTATPQLGRVVNGQQALALEAAKKLEVGSYIVADYWNQVLGGVLLTPINVGAFGSIGYIYLSGKSIAVIVDLANLTFELLSDYIARMAGGGGGTARDPYDVPAAKRIEVVDANVPAYLETNPAYYGCEFVDEVRGAGKPTCYRCLPSAPAVTGGATVWKWFRFDIL